MPDTLKSRQQQIPGGFRFVIPELNWVAPPFSSFDTIVQAVLQVVQKNAWLAARNHWPTEATGIGNWVEAYQCQLCRANGWTQYLADGNAPSPPANPPAPSLLQKLQAVAGAVRKVEAGVEALLEWEVSELMPVSLEEADNRSKRCANCQFNGQGEMTDWFTVPASELIRTRLERLHKLNLSTQLDEVLGTCTLCWCPLKLKVFSPPELVKKHLLPEVKQQLPDHCWMKNI